jgi:hypothetical protein
MSHALRQNDAQMPRKSLYYTPKISRFLVSVLYHEARSRRMPMTTLTEALLTKSLEGSKSWRAAVASLIRETPPKYRAEKSPKLQSSAAISSPNAARPPRPLAPARAASPASPAPSNPIKASKGTTLQRLSGNQNSPTLKEF